MYYLQIVEADEYGAIHFIFEIFREKWSYRGQILSGQIHLYEKLQNLLDLNLLASKC